MSIAKSHWDTVGALSAVVLTALLLAFAVEGIMTLISFPVQILGIGLIGLAICRHRQWWLLVTLPILLWPLFKLATLFYSCC